MKKTLKSFNLLLMIPLLIFLSTVSISAEQADDQTIIIKNIKTVIDGVTKRQALLEEIKLFEGKQFDNYDSLVHFMNESTQDLINMRVFEKAEYELEELGTVDGLREFTVTLSVIDTWNIYPIPYPKYDSNTGFRLGLKFYYFNAFGSLTDFTFFMNMDITENTAKGIWEVPNWHLTPGLSGFNLWGQDFSLELSHKFRTYKKYDSGILQQEYTLHNTSISLGTKLYLPLDFYYTMNPRLGFNYGETELMVDKNSIPLPDAGVEKDYSFSEFSWNHSIGFDNIDWIGNFRNGFSAYISNTLNVSSDLNAAKPVDFSSQLGAGMTFFWRLNRIFNLSSQIKGIWSFNKELTGLGSNLRGVLDDYMYGYLGAFMSIDLNISVIDWDGVGEIQLRPFFEMGIVGKENTAFDINNDFAYTAGADFVLYLDKLNSMQARATLAFDLSNPDWNTNYEIDITSSLSY